ncbi:MAG: ABC transporter ATP-binding protein [Acidobacteriota bacterium]
MTHRHPLLELRGVTKTYGTGGAAFRALRGVDLTIESGEFVAIMGASGSGKSTLMNILGCLDRPTDGQYLLGGRAVEGLSKEERALLRRHFLGFVFQGFNLLARTSALENVELPLLYRGLPRGERRAKARRALDAVGLLPWEKHAPNELSGGQQQRVAVARAMAADPQVLFADEPTGNLDSKVSQEVIQLITDLNREKGMTVVMVTHESEMAAHARRIVTVHDGLIASDVSNAPRGQIAPRGQNEEVA